ncbi:MAG TPA: coproporphyrinogen-III oxidase family protein, partial [Methylomirabilota bacterium]|nr:coproporphyrinogen-III oxidase family protein [Methylomirabilota bacterium]
MTRPASGSQPGEPALITRGAAGSRPPEALYVHVPFCVSLCPYCDFVVVAGLAARGPRNRVAAFLAALRRELELRADALDVRWGPVPGDAAAVETLSRTARSPLASLYLGGGTPSLLPAEEIAGIMELVRRRYGLSDDAEVTLEANPGPDERGDAAALRAAGVTRISFGAQALDDATLRVLGRRHHARDVAAAISDARNAGIPSLNLDLLYDVPGQTVAAWAGTLEAALDLRPDHLSLYALTLDDPDAEGLTGPTGDHLPVTRGARRWRGAVRGQDEDRAAAMYHHAVQRLAEAGFEGYEISNWARPGHESRHNLAYWERRPYEAVGPGGHAFDGATRRWNAARLDPYVAALTPIDGGPGRLPQGGEEVVDADAAAVEAVILGLRTSRGIPVAASCRPPLADHFDWALTGG